MRCQGRGVSVCLVVGSLKRILVVFKGEEAAATLAACTRLAARLDACQTLGLSPYQSLLVCCICFFQVDSKIDVMYLGSTADGKTRLSHRGVLMTDAGKTYDLPSAAPSSAPMSPRTPRSSEGGSSSFGGGRGGGGRGGRGGRGAYLEGRGRGRGRGRDGGDRFSSSSAVAQE
jgi:hypothetical protein